MPHKINHIAVVVENLENALGFWRDALGLELLRTENNAEEEVSIAFLPVGESEIELLQPTNPESGIGKYLAKRGAGLHHICLEVEDIDSSIAHLRQHHIELINESPRTREEGTRYCFVHPRSTGGVLVELYELPDK
ncbi:MAG TPA: methylmalonyl-CoA epimerase [Aggregatilineales bacterium]|nr:methylmalonyl-CoA epimerase [Aggregatilineales bacterium]